MRSGVDSLINASGRTFYILEHFMGSKYHHAGEKQEIILDNVSLGRDPKCQVRFDESFGTVSRNHAAITRDGENWKLVQLSETNSTLLNGHKVDKEWFLQSGDIIQLSVNGPKLKFTIPTGNEAQLSSLSLGKRLNLFGKQALMPYKWALASLMGLVLLCIGGGGWWIHNISNNNKELRNAIAKNEIEQQRQKAASDSVIAQLTNLNKALTEQADSNKNELEKMNMRITSLAKMQSHGASVPKMTRTGISPQIKNPADSAATGTYSVEDVIDEAVFFIRPISLKIISPAGSKTSVDLNENVFPTGTAFLTSDGNVYTTRRIIEPWAFFENKLDTVLALINLIAANGGKATVTYELTAPSGKTMTMTNSQFIIDRSHDLNTKEKDVNITIASTNPAYNVARAKVKGKSRLKRSSQFDSSTEMLTANFKGNTPELTVSKVKCSGGKGKYMMLSGDTNSQTGSGGPVIAQLDKGSFHAVGMFIKTKDTCAMIPLSCVK